MGNVGVLEDFWSRLVLAFPSSSRLDDAVVVCYPKVPFFAVNHAAQVTATDNSAGLVAAVQAHFRSNGVAFACFRVSPLTPQAFISHLNAEGYRCKGTQSVMVYDGKIKKSPNPSIFIREVACQEDLVVYSRLMLSIFEMPPQWETGFLEFNQESIKVGWRFYIADLNDSPVGTCALFSSDGVGGIFNVGVLPEVRGRGVGSTLTFYALEKSFAEGNNVHTLQAECGGNAEHIYARLGFRIDHVAGFYAKNI